MMELHGKIFVVALVLAVIFAGLAFFLFFLERRLGKLEQKLDEISEVKEQARKHH